MSDYKVSLRVVGWRFGKNWIDYTIKNISTDSIINEGTCSEIAETTQIYNSLVSVYGVGKVLFLQE